jgi:hypothetical protein
MIYTTKKMKLMEFVRDLIVMLVGLSKLQEP